MKANDLGKLGTGKKRNSNSARTSTGSNAGASSSRAPKRLQTDPEDKPWEARFQRGLPKKGVKLIELSDDE